MQLAASLGALAGLGALLHGAGRRSTAGSTASTHKSDCDAPISVSTPEARAVSWLRKYDRRADESTARRLSCRDDADDHMAGSDECGTAEYGSALHRLLGPGHTFVCFRDNDGDLLRALPTDDNDALYLGCSEQPAPSGTGRLTQYPPESLFLASSEDGQHIRFKSCSSPGTLLHAARDSGNALKLGRRPASPSDQWRISPRGLVNARWTDEVLDLNICIVVPVSEQALSVVETSTRKALSSRHAQAKERENQLVDGSQRIALLVQAGQRQAEQHRVEVELLKRQLTEAVERKARLEADSTTHSKSIREQWLRLEAAEHRANAAEEEADTLYSRLVQETKRLQLELAEALADASALAQQLQEHEAVKEQQREQLESEVEAVVCERDNAIQELEAKANEHEGTIQALADSCDRMQAGFLAMHELLEPAGNAQEPRQPSPGILQADRLKLLRMLQQYMRDGTPTPAAASIGRSHTNMYAGVYDASRPTTACGTAAASVRDAAVSSSLQQERLSATPVLSCSASQWAQQQAGEGSPPGGATPGAGTSSGMLPCRASPAHHPSLSVLTTGTSWLLRSEAREVDCADSSKAGPRAPATPMASFAALPASPPETTVSPRFASRGHAAEGGSISGAAAAANVEAMQRLRTRFRAMQESGAQAAHSAQARMSHLMLRVSRATPLSNAAPVRSRAASVAAAGPDGAEREVPPPPGDDAADTVPELCRPSHVLAVSLPADGGEASDDSDSCCNIGSTRDGGVYGFPSACESALNSACASSAFNHSAAAGSVPSKLPLPSRPSGIPAAPGRAAMVQVPPALPVPITSSGNDEPALSATSKHTHHATVRARMAAPLPSQLLSELSTMPAKMLLGGSLEELRATAGARRCQSRSSAQPDSDADSDAAASSSGSVSWASIDNPEVLRSTAGHLSSCTGNETNGYGSPAEVSGSSSKAADPSRQQQRHAGHQGRCGRAPGQISSTNGDEECQVFVSPTSSPARVDSTQSKLPLPPPLQQQAQHKLQISHGRPQSGRVPVAAAITGRTAVAEESRGGQRTRGSLLPGAARVAQRSSGGGTAVEWIRDSDGSRDGGSGREDKRLGEREAAWRFGASAGGTKGSPVTSATGMHDLAPRGGSQRPATHKQMGAKKMT